MDIGDELDIEKEYKTNANLKRQDIQALREWAEARFPPHSEVQLFLFLHGCAYDLDKAKTKIIAYHKLREETPELFSNVDATEPSFRKHLNVTAQWPLSRRTDEGDIIIITRIIDSDYRKYKANEQLKIFFIVAEAVLRAQGNCNGLVLVVGSAKLGWGHLPKFGISLVRKMLNYLQEAFEAKLIAVHVINTSVVNEKIMNIVKLFLRKEFSHLLHIYSDMEEFYKRIPKSYLPEDLGGDDLTFTEIHAKMIAKLTRKP